LSKEGEDAIVLVERLQAREEPQKQLELFPLASIQCFLCPISDALHGLDGDFWLDIIGVVGDGGDERNLEGLLDNPEAISEMRDDG
jgi:hypothetical protein